MEKVIITEEASDFLDELIAFLFEEEYFGFMTSSIKYVNNIYDFIYTIPTLKKKNTRNNKYGNWYCSYKHNTKTTWYITFDVEDGIYLVTHITNNHTADYPKYIIGL